MNPLVRLRRDLDIMPSPIPDRPGILIRDPMRYSDAMMLIPWPLAPCLNCFDGQQTELELRETMVRVTGGFEVGKLLRDLIDGLRDSAFLEDEFYLGLRESRERDFRLSTERPAVHAGSGYPGEPDRLAETMTTYLSSAARSPDLISAIAAPHVSPFGGWQSYNAAYRRMPETAADRTFVVLGTSHYGEPEKFGLTAKRFVTPLGATRSDGAFARELAERAPGSTKVEDYCHSIEHSIEFQVLFLQWLYGPEITVLPILCGAFVRSIRQGGNPEDDAGIARFFEALTDIAARESNRLFWVLGIDMAHIGRRYYDSFSVRANEGRMQEIAARDEERMKRVAAGDADGFWSLVQQNQDDLRWCGASPLYTFLRVQPQLRGTVERYEQWNIDEQSVVSFAGMTFRP